MKEWSTGDRCLVEVLPGTWREGLFKEHKSHDECVVMVKGYASRYPVTRKVAHLKEVSKSDD